MRSPQKWPKCSVGLNLAVISTPDILLCVQGPVWDLELVWRLPRGDHTSCLVPSERTCRPQHRRAPLRPHRFAHTRNCSDGEGFSEAHGYWWRALGKMCRNFWEVARYTEAAQQWPWAIFLKKYGKLPGLMGQNIVSLQKRGYWILTSVSPSKPWAPIFFDTGSSSEICIHFQNWSDVVLPTQATGHSGAVAGAPETAADPPLGKQHENRGVSQDGPLLNVRVWCGRRGLVWERLLRDVERRQGHLHLLLPRGSSHTLIRAEASFLC